MTTLRMLAFVSAFVCLSAQAQSCSGGADGGMDVTGNQCNVSQDSAAYASPAAVTTAPSAPAAAPMVPGASSKASHSAAATPRTSTSHAATAGRSASRRSVGTKPPAKVVHTARIDETHDVLCSGGADGGMDATGNQCNPAATMDHAVLALVRAR